MVIKTNDQESTTIPLQVIQSILLEKAEKISTVQVRDTTEGEWSATACTILFISRKLLSDTEFTKDVIKLVFVRDFAGDLAKIVEAPANVERKEIAGDVVVQAMAYIG